MDQYIVFDSSLTKPDRIVLENLAVEVRLFSVNGLNSGGGAISSKKFDERTSSKLMDNDNDDYGKNLRHVSHGL